MPLLARYILACGIIGLSLTVFNAYEQELISPGFERAEVLSGISSVCLMLVSFLWSERNPAISAVKSLEGKQGFELCESLNEDIREEIAWGSKLILTSTPAATILIYWNDKCILRRGVMGSKKFVPGEICKRAINSGKMISLVKTSLYPGKEELYNYIDQIPSVIVSPINKSGVLIIGGWTERCFSKSDEMWIEGWKERLCQKLLKYENS